MITETTEGEDVMASPTFQAISGMAARRTIEPGSAAGDPDDDTQEEQESAMPRRNKRADPVTRDERDALIVRMYQAGTPNREIREAAGLKSDGAIYNAIHKAGVSPRQTYHTNGHNVPDPVLFERELPVGQVEPDEEDDGPEMHTYVLQVEIMRPVLTNVEVDVESFDEAVAAAHALPDLVRIHAVLRADSLKRGD